MISIGVRREDKNRWEARVPLTPDHVAELVEKHGLDLVVQPSELRAFADKDYLAAGATVEESLERCGLVLGVKEIPIPQIDANRAYLFFSHTTKGQPYNMPLLAHILDRGATLMDYEHVLDRRGRRLIFFGRYAGHAGMIDSLWALGRRLEYEGLTSPFERVRLAHDYSSLDEATNHIHRIGERLRHSGLPEGLQPLICGFTGSGNVARGAQEIFDRLPHVELDPEELPDVAGDTERPRNVVYRVNFARQHRFERIEGGEVDFDELDSHPERYRNGMHRYLPYLTLLIHGAFWKPSQPRVVSIEDLDRLWSGETPPSLRVIADISCDINGGIEATTHATTPGDPVYVYDLEKRQPIAGVAGRGPIILAVDNLPCQLPVEASAHFGDTLMRFVPMLARCDWRRPWEELTLPGAILNSVVTHRGELAPSFEYLNRTLAKAGLERRESGT